MKVQRDIIGMRFGSVTVLDQHIVVRYKYGTKIKWLCRCDCGNEMYIFRDAIVKRRSDYCCACRPVGRRNTKLYHVYHGMLQRCYNVNNPRYETYGGRGVRVCDEWIDNYESFLSWSMSNGYSEGLTIDRIDPDGPYDPNNCRWISISENSARANVGRNKNKSKMVCMKAIDPDGNTYDIDIIKHFCDEHGLNYSTVNAYLHGRVAKNNYHGWKFISDQRNESVTTIPQGSTSVDELPVEAQERL